MTDNDPINAYDDFEKALADSKDTHYVFRLYVAGNTQKSANTILKLRQVCEEYLKGQYELEVIDIYQQPSAAKTDEVIATPTLVKRLPLPIRRIIGDLTEKDRILVGLNLSQADGSDGAEPQN